MMAEIDGDKTDPRFDQASCQQRLSTPFVLAIPQANGFRFLTNVERLPRAGPRDHTDRLLRKPIGRFHRT